MKAVARGVGRWAGGEKAAAKLLPARTRRRATRLTRIVAEAVSAALADAKMEADALADARIVLVSDWGELGATATLLESLRTDPSTTSPTAFTNSVHNTSTGYLSLGLGDREGSTALAAGEARIGLGLFEAMAAIDVNVDLQGGASLALLILADERIPDPLSGGRETDECALALILSREGSGRRLELQRGEAGVLDAPGVDGTASAALTLERAFAADSATQVTLPGGWELGVSSPDA